MSMLSMAQKSVFSKSGRVTNWQTTSEVVLDVSNEKLVRCLDLLLADEYLLNRASCRSYRHQLGFQKLVLMDDAMGSCLRLHLWDTSSTALEDIHSHCADFFSRVVFGGLTENSFDLVDGESHVRFRYRFDVNAGHSIAVHDGITGISLRERRIILSGGIYKKHASDLHNVNNVEQGTVTVSAWGPRDVDALVLKHYGATPEDCSAVSGMPLAEMRTTLKNIKQRLANK